MKPISHLCFNPFPYINALLHSLQHCGGHFIHMEPPYLVGLWQVPPHSSLCSGWHSSESSLPPWTFTSPCLVASMDWYPFTASALTPCRGPPQFTFYPLFHCIIAQKLTLLWLSQHFKTGSFRKGKERKEKIWVRGEKSIPWFLNKRHLWEMEWDLSLTKQFKKEYGVWG